MLVYSPDFTRQSRLAQSFLAELNSLCMRDYGRAYFNNTIVCIDLDAYESSCTGNKDATMDAATGMADWRKNHASNDRHLLVELRFGYKSTQHFDLGNMKRKVTHSRDILYPDQVNPQAVFLFDDEVAPRARNYFSRLSIQDHEIKKWLAMDVEGFSNFIVDRVTLPYEPENNLEEIVSDLKKKYSEGGLNALDVLVKYWIEQMVRYNLRYMQAESNAIAEVILAFLQSLSFSKGSFEDDYLALRVDDVKHFIAG